MLTNAIQAGFYFWWGKMKAKEKNNERIPIIKFKKYNGGSSLDVSSMLLNFILICAECL